MLLCVFSVHINRFIRLGLIYVFLKFTFTQKYNNFDLRLFTYNLNSAFKNEKFLKYSTNCQQHKTNQRLNIRNS